MGHIHSLGRLLPMVERQCSSLVKQGTERANAIKHFMIDGGDSKVIKSIDGLLDRVPPAAFHVSRLLEHLLPDDLNTGKNPRKNISTLIKVVNQRGATNPTLLKDEERQLLIFSAIEIIRELRKDDPKLTEHLKQIGGFDHIPAHIHPQLKTDDGRRTYISTQAVWHLLYQLGMTVDFKTLANKWVHKSIETNKDFISSTIKDWGSMDFEVRDLFVKKVVGVAIDQTRDLKINIKSPGVTIMDPSRTDFASYTRRHVQGNAYFHELAINRHLLYPDPSRHGRDPSQPIRLISCIHHELTHAWQYSRFEELELNLFPRTHKNLSALELEDVALLLCCELDMFLQDYQLDVSAFIPKTMTTNYEPCASMYLPHEIQAWSVSLMALKQLYKHQEFRHIRPDVIHFIKQIGHQFEWLNQRYLIWEHMDEAIDQHQPSLNDLYPEHKKSKGLKKPDNS